jgi:hypothetical protein
MGAWGSNASSAEASHPLTRRSANSAGWVEVIRPGCIGWSPDVRTPVPSFLERSPALQTPVSPQRRCLALLPWWSPVRSREVGSGVCCETKR